MSSCLANFVLGIYSHSYKAHSLTNDRLSPRAILAKYLAAVNHEDFYANEQTNVTACLPHNTWPTHEY